MAFNLQSYMDKISQTPNEAYRGLVQATISAQFDNTTQSRKIQEEKFPFNNEYEEYTVWINSVSDTTVSMNKVIGNYIDILFEDQEHVQNYRGTKYIYDGETYLTYDKLNMLNMAKSTKAIKCNNYLSIKLDDGSIRKEPVFIGWEISSTNPQISVDGTTENRRLVVLVQNNKYTDNITVNQRFILNHKRAFKVESIDDMQMEHIDNDVVTLNTLYIAWDVILPTDDLVNNLASGNTDMKYKLNINQESFSQQKGYIGKLDCTVKRGDEVITNPNVVWTTSNYEVIQISEDGTYEVIGESGESAIITCTYSNDINAVDSIVITVSDVLIDDSRIVISPNINSINKKRSVVLTAKLQVNGVYLDNETICTRDWIDDKFYTLEPIGDNQFILTCNLQTSKLLTLTFLNGDKTESMSIKLEGLF